MELSLVFQMQALEIALRSKCFASGAISPTPCYMFEEGRQGGLLEEAAFEQGVGMGLQGCEVCQGGRTKGSLP